MDKVSVELFVKFKELYINKNFHDYYLWRKWVLAEAIEDIDFIEELTDFLDSLNENTSAENINEVFEKLREKMIYNVKMANESDNIDKRIDSISRAMAYVGVIESLDEHSCFCDNIIDSIRKKYGDRFFEIIEQADRSNLSVDVRSIKNCDDYFEDSDEPLLKKYLVLKKWQDYQHSYYWENINDLMYKIMDEYVNAYSLDPLLGKKNALVLRTCNRLLKKAKVNIDILAKYYLLGMKDEIIKIFGGKAFGLAVLRAEGAIIPKTEVISVLQEDYKNLLPNFTSDLYAIRSSADIEDGEEHSFAGMFDSILGVRENEIEKAVIAVKKSVANERVKQYILSKKLKEPKMGVVIQSYTEPDYSGVWLGNTISSGYLEYVKGSGEKLVAGKINPYSENWEKFKSKDNYLKLNSGQEVGKVLIELQERLGVVADFEWCIIEGKLIMLQYRPITAKCYIDENINSEKIDYTDDGYKINYGIAASSGYIEGKAEYVDAIENYDLKLWEDGNILMSEFTEPEWLSLLIRSSGVITEVGGFLCHTAIIARELGIPCVSGVGKNICNEYNGKYVAVDGSKGKFYEIKKLVNTKNKL